MPAPQVCQALTCMISASLVFSISSMRLIAASVKPWTSVPPFFSSSSLMSEAFSAAFRSAMASRRTLRTAMRFSSAYLPAILTSSLRRSSVSGGIGTRRVWPSVIGFKPRPELRMAFSTDGDQAPVPDIDADHARLGHRDRGARQDRHAGAVGIDSDTFQQGRRGTAGAQATEIVLEREDGLVHAVFVFIEIEKQRP